MKSILLIGLGRFGRHIAIKLQELGHEVMAIDNQEHRIDAALPYVTNVSVVGIPSEVMVNYLSEMGIYVSGGSACAKGHKSRVLQSMKLDGARINSAIRISLSRYTTKDEIDYLIQGISSAQKSIMKRIK